MLLTPVSCLYLTSIPVSTLTLFLQAISAKVGEEACCDWVGEDGSGHFVKMVHNGIEYGDMQLICEAYHIMKDTLGIDNDEMSEIFNEWNKGELDSFLIEITGEVLAQNDPESGKAFVDIVLDTAGQKGTGKWTSISALDLGVPAPTVAEAVFARCLSAIGIADARRPASRSR